jgi:hypothetical protein
MARSKGGGEEGRHGIRWTADRTAALLSHREQVAHPLYCHADFVETLTAPEFRGLQRRATLVLRHLLAHGRTSVVKGTQGAANRGWRRTPLGGGGGCHYYLWWAPRGAPPVATLEGPRGAIFLRAARHHDEHAPLDGDSLDEYVPIRVDDLRREEDHPSPYTEEQLLFSHADQPLRVLVGQPGTGKTEALWNAVDLRAGEQVLYLTWSRQLSVLAREHFQAFAPSTSRVETWALSDLLGEIVEAPLTGGFEDRRAAFLAACRRLDAKLLGPWEEWLDCLFAETRAHLVGAALPDQPQELQERDRVRLSAAEYGRRRGGEIGEETVRALLATIKALESGGQPIERFFPDLLHAGRAARCLQRTQGWPRQLSEPPQRIIVDEIQDLTPVEMLVPILLARRAAEENGRAPFFLCAGDEGQTVRPTDFDWGRFKSLLTRQLQRPEEFRLVTNLRSPRCVGRILRRTQALYGQVPKGSRPRGATASADVEHLLNETLLHCVAPAEEESTWHAVEMMLDLPGAVVIGRPEAQQELARRLDLHLAAEKTASLLTPDLAKGREFQVVCILDPGRWLQEIAKADRRGKARELAPLWRRGAIDRFRVAVSRTTETLIFFDTDTAPEALQASHKLLNKLDAIPMNAADLMMHLRDPAQSVDSRVQECIEDALRWLDSSRPETAWRRALQAVRSLGDQERAEAVSDPTLRAEAWETLARVAFFLAHPRSAKSGVGLTTGELLIEAARAGKRSGNAELGGLFRALAGWHRAAAGSAERLAALAPLAQALRAAEPLPSWLESGLRVWRTAWGQLLEEQTPPAATALSFASELPQLLRRLGFARGSIERRVEEFRERTIEALLTSVPGAASALEGGGKGNAKAGERMEGDVGGEATLRAAVALLDLLKSPPPLLRARILEAMGNPAAAGEWFERAQEPELARGAYRRAGDFDGALRLAAAEGEETELLRWLVVLRDHLEQRPTDLRKRLSAGETHRLQQLLDRLGI